MMPYMPLLLSFAQRYVKNMGIGTLIAALMPYSIAFFHRMDRDDPVVVLHGLAAWS